MRRTATFAAIVMLLSACKAFAWPVFVGAEAGGLHRVLQLDRGGTVTDVTLESVETTEMVVDTDGTLILGLRDGRIVRWDLTRRVVTDLASGFSPWIEALVISPDGLYVADGLRGVYRVDSGGAIVPIYEDPIPAAFRYRYEGATLVTQGPFAGSLFVLRRPFRCFAEPQMVMRFADPISPATPPELTPVAFYALDMASRRDQLVLTEWTCVGTEDFRTLDPVTHVSRMVPLPPYLNVVVNLAVDEDSQVIRVATGTSSGLDALVVDRVDFDTGTREFVFGLYARFESMAVDARSPLDRLPCRRDPKNHGAYVSCVAHTTKDLVRAGRMDDATRSGLIREAAWSAEGK